MPSPEGPSGAALWVALLYCATSTFAIAIDRPGYGHLTGLTNKKATAPVPVIVPTRRASSAELYAEHWSKLLQREYRENADQLKERRKAWSHKRLEASGLSVFDASATPETDIYGEKVVRVIKSGAVRLDDKFSRGDILLLSPDGRTPSWDSAASDFVPRECCVVDAGDDWITVGVGRYWPTGLWEARRRPGTFGVILERTAPQAALKAQKNALDLLCTGAAGEAAALLASDSASLAVAAALLPPRLTSEDLSDGPSARTAIHEDNVDLAIQDAINQAKSSASFVPNDSQESAIGWALSRRLSLIRGPPGTGKTRTAALLISSALRLQGAQRGGGVAPAPRVLAVAHSNGAADVLLAALLRLGVRAVRAGRPASVSPSVRCRTVVALAEKHPEVVGLKMQARNASLPPRERSAASAQLRNVIDDVGAMILGRAEVVVSSCVGAHQLLATNVSFPLVVLDEGSQATEPALVCALASARAEQLVLVGDTRQLPPTVASASTELRTSLGRSPMSRLERMGFEERTLQVQPTTPHTLALTPRLTPNRVNAPNRVN